MLALAGCLFSVPCRADAPTESKRVALLIANGTYPEAGLPQESPGKDAALLAGELTRDAFDVDLKNDLTLDGLNAAVGEFLGKITPGTSALLYFNGIGIQVSHQTYLIPVNADIWSEADVKRNGVDINAVVAEMQRRGASVKIVILDAARRNPFERRFRSSSDGLAGIDAPEGSLVIYATALNKVAPDSNGEISLFMDELVKELRTPEVSAEDAIMHTRVGVARASNGDQVPWFASSLIDPFYIGQAPDSTQVEGAPPAASPPPMPKASPPARAVPPVTPAPPKPAPQPKATTPEPPPSPPQTAALSPATPPAPPAVSNPPQEPSPKPSAAPPPPAAPPPAASAPSPPPPALPPVPAPSQRPVQPSEGAKKAPIKEPAPAKQEAQPADLPPPRIVTDTPGAIFRDCPKCPEMVVLPAGAFQMGTGKTPFDRPVHRVEVAKPFAIARDEVTFDEWGACLAEGACAIKPDDQGFGEGSHPVINVSWSDAQDYVAWLARKTGKTYRLPSESEWEYAAHGGTTTPFAWGAAVGEHMANCADCGSGLDSPKTAEVRSYPANGFGIFDMAGNAAEWVEDCWHQSYKGAPKDGSAWLGDGCTQRVLRGGSFDTGAAYTKPSARFRYDADVRYWANGFRVVRDLP